MGVSTVVGYIRHNAIVVTSFKQEAIEAALVAAAEIFPARQVTTVAKVEVNQYFTFLVGPDGASEGGEAQRQRLIAWLEASEWSYVLDWVEIEYGGDGGPVEIINDSDGEPE